MAFQPPVRKMKQLTTLAKGAILIVSAVHMGLYTYSSGDASTSRVLNEERANEGSKNEEGRRELIEVRGDCSFTTIFAGNKQCTEMSADLWSGNVEPAAVGEPGGVTPEFCEENTNWWSRTGQLKQFYKFCRGGFVDGECPAGNCLTIDALVSLEAWEEFDIEEDEAQGDEVIIQADEQNGAGGVNGDPLFIGIRGQVFKFEGKSDTWYANLATDSVQWNLLFNEFETCPKDENMFVTKSSVLLRDSNNRITVGVLDKDKFSPGCAPNTVCLGEGSLGIEINGQVIRSPGEYDLANNAGRVVVHNTYDSCSRKWYDYVVSKKDNIRSGGNRALIHYDYQETAMDLLFKHHGEMLDPKQCLSWLEKRAENGDLFSQKGSWTTIHIETKDISMHMEYRQADEACNSHLIDSWISKVSPVILTEEWKGILGETRYPKFHPDGSEIETDRKALLVGQNDEDYEVTDQYEGEFTARDMFSVDASSIGIE